MITGEPMSVGMEELQKNIKGGKVMNVQRMKTTKEGVKRNGEMVLI